MFINKLFSMNLFRLVYYESNQRRNPAVRPACRSAYGTQASFGRSARPLGGLRLYKCYQRLLSDWIEE
jgi:hypothetical protein